MMETIKIQINHISPVVLEILSSLLYDEIGEEYNIELDTIKEYFNFEYTYILPNESFISIVTFQIPKFELRDIELKDIVFSFLNSVKELDNVISVIKLNDTILRQRAFKYYQQIIDIEMDLRNILTYIITYDSKSISEQLLKNFGINKSEKVEYNKLQEKYENGLFYIYFNHYTEFTTPEKLKTNEMLDFLQDPSIDSFERFKNKLQKRGIQEERHVGFLSSIRTKIKPLEKMRNTIMHIRNLTDNVEENFIKATEDNMEDKGLKSLIQDFWQNEQIILKEQTLLALSKKYIKTIFDNIDYQDGILYIDEKYQNEIVEEEYSNYDDIQDDIMAYIVEEINIFEDALFGDIADELDELICSYWNNITTDE